ncbi:family 20 glycosylhydrolase [candidate division KSB1 bacterium]|nr:family 20 glycosylhydrolase [candidate division KSB1 bacterium]
MQKPHFLMPVPQQFELDENQYRLSDTFAITVKGDCHPRLFRAATRTLRRLAGRTGLFFPQDFITAETAPDQAAMTIRVNRPGQVVLYENESYRLVVNAEQIVLEAETDIGALRGLETFLQLLEADKNGYYIRGAEIKDSPRFPWRGLLIDACRHFMPVDVIKRNLDGMAAVKLNVLHWHLTEDQGFRVESKTWPKLHELGSDGFYYTQAQIKDVVQYAADRGIRVVPEFDMPGHATSWLTAYPELASAPGPYTVERKWGIMDPTMDPTREFTYEFLDAFLKEMSGLFPDEYIHIGGDENNGKQWDANEDIQQFKKSNNISDNHALQSYFNNRILKILTRYGKKMVGWDEILHPDMPTTIVIQSWRGRKSLIESARKGYQVMLSNGYYIDLIQPTDFHYLNDPIPEDTPLSPDEQKFILGGEATMWAEFVIPETVDSRIWPRTAAIAERFWSPGSVKDVDDMYRRLDEVSFRLEELGLLHIKNKQMMLRRLTNNTDVTALEILVDVIEPVKIYTRGAQRAYTQQSPLTRVVDVAVADAEKAREFRGLVDAYFSEPAQSKLDKMKETLDVWNANHDKLLTTIGISPVLKEIESLSADLSACAQIGLEAIALVENGTRADEDWIKEKLETLEKAKAPRGQTELMIVSAVEKLVKRAGKM